MRYALILSLAATLWTSAAYAQEPRGYVEGIGGLAKLTGTKTADAGGEVGFRIAPNVLLFANVGRLHDIQSSSLQTSVDNEVSALAAGDLTATGTSHTPASYSMGGLRIQFANHSAITPYVFGGVGVARMSPTVRFTYDSGTTLSGNSVVVGDDITSDVVSIGGFTQPLPTTNLMVRGGGGVLIPLGKHLLGDIGYSQSRISTDTPIHTQDLTFGLGFKF